MPGHSLRHGMLLDAKRVMDDAMPELIELEALVPERLHAQLKKVLRDFEDTLCECDVSDDYAEKK